MKNLYRSLLVLVHFAFFQYASALNITIIESQSFNSGHTMDVRWLGVCTAMGHSATIYPKTQLDLLSNLSTTDILIVASGVDNTLYNPARVAVIEQYLQAGGKVYIQSEYLDTFDGNISYKSIVNYF